MEKWELDVRVLLNNNTYVNMEMQVLNHGNWPERSLQYLDLTCIELATEEDKNRHTDRLAKLFKATTWEEINMLATNNTIITLVCHYKFDDF